MSSLHKSGILQVHKWPDLSLKKGTTHAASTIKNQVCKEWFNEILKKRYQRPEVNTDTH